MKVTTCLFFPFPVPFHSSSTDMCVGDLAFAYYVRCTPLFAFTDPDSLPRSSGRVVSEEEEKFFFRSAAITSELLVSAPRGPNHSAFQRTAMPLVFHFSTTWKVPGSDSEA